MNDPILICGARRSGTTLMMAILCSDPRANAVMPECQLLTRLIEAYQSSVARYDDFGSPVLGARSGFDGMYSRWAQELVDAIRTHAGEHSLLVLKHPAMLSCLGELRTLLPRVRTVVMVRDPRDQIASEFEVSSRAGRDRPTVGPFATRLAESFQGFDCTNSVVVRYEDLVGNFQAMKGRLESALGLNLTFDQENAWPDIGGLAGLRRYPAWSAKYGGPIDNDGVGRFASEFDADEIEEIERTCAEYMARFEYFAEHVK